jgi:glycosyltransferase involved in cell wall biosynthesis
VSIVTTVYDRVECLQRCMASVQRLEFRDYEHIIVSDCPPKDIVRRLAEIVTAAQDDRIGYFNLKERYNNWGITPASVGLRRARGEYLSFLSDDNGYTPNHLGGLLEVLDCDPRLGFAYSSCRYDGRTVLRDPVPRPARIDLGQPLFRRELLSRYFNDELPFGVMAWDWHMIEALLARGVRCMHVDEPSFIFRLEKYPSLMIGSEPVR